MKISSLIAVLCNFEAAVAAVSSVGTPSGFKELRQLFLGHEDKNVAPFVNTLLKQRDIHGHRTNSLPIARLRDVLAKLETCLRSAEGNKAADDVARLAELLKGCGQASVNEFVSEARDWLVEATRPTAKLQAAAKRARPARKKPAALSVETLPPADYATLLERTAKDNTQFDQIVERLRADRRIKKADMREIARLFLGYELAKKKGREDALAEIAAKQAVEARQEARGSVLDRLKSW
ncbi:MAG TPA: hypothetical protein VKP67_04600 [Xanthobacteraceae bacterium]|nr:hypothetical protein [Xanthobacteraceae bacterium]